MGWKMESSNVIPICLLIQTNRRKAEGARAKTWKAKTTIRNLSNPRWTEDAQSNAPKGQLIRRSSRYIEVQQMRKRANTRV